MRCRDFLSQQKISGIFCAMLLVLFTSGYILGAARIVNAYPSTICTLYRIDYIACEVSSIKLQATVVINGNFTSVSGTCMSDIDCNNCIIPLLAGNEYECVYIKDNVIINIDNSTYTDEYSLSLFLSASIFGCILIVSTLSLVAYNMGLFDRWISREEAEPFFA